MFEAEYSDSTSLGPGMTRQGCLFLVFSLPTDGVSCLLRRLVGVQMQKMRCEVQTVRNITCCLVWEC